MLTFAQAKELFDYDPTTGHIFWAKKDSRRIKVGARAGCPNDYGYERIRHRGVSYMSHRIAWLLTYGEWPDRQIDHINGDRMDNRIENLREATPAENQQNLKLRKDNTSGFAGVRKSLRKWQAVIAVNGKRITLGNYDTAEAAAAAYAEAKARLHTFQPTVRAA